MDGSSCKICGRWSEERLFSEKSFFLLVTFKEKEGKPLYYSNSFLNKELCGVDQHAKKNV